MRILLAFVLLTITSAFALSSPARGTRGPYLEGKTVYRMRLWRCAMLWRRFGDIEKSSGKRLTKNSELYQELAKLSERQFHRWLANPRRSHPRVNCRVGHFANKREVMSLWHYIQRRAFNPPRKPQIVRREFKRTTIRLVKTQKLLRDRLETLRRIRKYLPDYKGNSASRKSTRSNRK